MFDINNLGDIETLKDGDQTLILRFDDEGFADLMQCNFSMLMENNTSIWYNGTYAPTGTTTANSYYINTTTGEIYSSTTSTVNDVSTSTWQKNPLMTITGSAGTSGIDGKSAYEVAVANGYTGTVTQWLASLIGANGPDGTRTYFVYSVPTAAISDSRGFCRIGDYAIVTYATTGESDPEAGQTYVYQGGNTWSGPLTISKATTGPMGPAITLQSSSSITTTEVSDGVYKVSLAQNYLALDASSNIDQTITQGSNSTAFSISNSSGAAVDLGVTISGTTNILSLSSAKTTALMTVNNNGDKAFISPDGSYFDSNKISTDGSGNLTAVSYIGNGDTLTVTDPTTSSTETLEVALSNIYTKENNFLLLTGGTVSGNLSVEGLLYFGDKSGGSYGIELGDQTSGGSNSTYIDFHSYGSTNDFDSRILSTGGESGASGQGTVNIYSKQLIVNSPITLDSGKITSDGSGNIISQGNITFVGTNGIHFGSDQTTSLWLNYNTTSHSLDTNGNFNVTGTTSLDNGKITTDGSGNVEVNSLRINANVVGVSGSTMSSNSTVVGQGAQMGWNLKGGDAWTYFTNVVPNNGYDSSGFYWQTVITGNSIISTTPCMSLSGKGDLSVSSLKLGNLDISEKTDSSSNVGYVITSSDSYHVDIFGGKLSSAAAFDFSDKNIRSFYSWPSSPEGQFIFGFSTQSSTVDSVLITQTSTTFNNNIIVTGTSSLDNGKITTDGSGNINCNSMSVSVTEGLTAIAVTTSDTSAITTALKLSSTVNVLTTVPSSGAVSLPSVSIGTTITVLNRGQNTLLIYPDATTSQIETLSTGTYQSMVSGGSGSFMKTSSTMWRVV